MTDTLSKAMKMTDTLVNLVSGLGTQRDKRSYTEFTDIQLDESDLGVLYKNWLFGKVVDIPADDMTRKWRKPKAPSLEPEQLETFKQVERDLNVRGKVNTALKWARLYGGSVIIMGVNDGDDGTLAEPLEVEQVTQDSLQSLLVLDRFDVSVNHVNYSDLQNFRLPEFYYLPNGTPVHHTRVIRFDGYELPWKEFERNNYWGGSICERVYDEVLNTKLTTQSISSMLFETNIDVVTVKNLFERIMNKQTLASLLKRFELASLTKSINKTLIIDQDNETFERKGQNFSGLPSLISEYLSVCSAAADIPVTRFLGQSAKGFSATGEGDLKNYYDMISSKQETDLFNPLYKLDQVLVRSALGMYPDDWDFTFCSLWQMTEKEKAEVNKLEAEEAEKNYNLGAIQSHHIAARLLDQGIYPTLTAYEVEAMEQVEEFVQAEEYEKILNPPEEAPAQEAPEAAQEAPEGDQDEPPQMAEEGEQEATQADPDEPEADMEAVAPEADEEQDQGEAEEDQEGDS